MTPQLFWISRTTGSRTVDTGHSGDWGVCFDWTTVDFVSTSWCGHTLVCTFSPSATSVLVLALLHSAWQGNFQKPCDSHIPKPYIVSWCQQVECKTPTGINLVLQVFLLKSLYPGLCALWPGDTKIPSVASLTMHTLSHLSDCTCCSGRPFSFLCLISAPLSWGDSSYITFCMKLSLFSGPWVSHSLLWVPVTRWFSA